MPVTLMESPERLVDAGREWNALAARALGANLFNTHDWLSAWWSAFARDSDRLRIYCVRREGRLVAVAPMMVRSVGGNGFGSLASRTELRTLFNHYLGRSDFLLDPDHPDAIGEIFDAFSEDRGLWDVAELVQVPEDSPVFLHLQERGAANLSVHAVRNIASPFLETRGRSFAQYYESRFSSRKRQQDRRRRRQAEKLGGFSLRVIDDPETVRACFEEGMTIEDRSWKGNEGSSILRAEGASAFMRDVVARFSARQQATLVDCRIADRQAAFLLGFVHRGCFYFHKTGYDPRFQAVSPGRIVLLRSIEGCFDRGLERYDFLGAADDYKVQCSPVLRPHATVFLHHGGLRSRVYRSLKRTLAPLAKEVLDRGERFEVRLDR